MVRLLIGLVLLVGLAQCHERKYRPPKAEGFDPPITPQKSYVSGSITFDLKEIERKINTELDPVLIGKQPEKGKSEGILSFRVKRLGNVTVQFENQQIKLSAPLQMWLTKPFSSDTTPPKKPFCVIHVSFKSPISVTPNWRFASHTTFTDYRWLVKPELRILGKDISLEKLAHRILDRHKADIEKAIDTAVYNHLRLDQMVRPTWEGIQKPLLINKEYGLWLVPKPVSVVAAPVTGNSTQLISRIRIAFETQTKVTPQTPSYTKTPLPRLQKLDSIPLKSDLHLLSYIPYADINRVMASTIRQAPKKMESGKVIVKDVSVYGAQQSLIVKAEVGGVVDGVVYLRGRPAFDTLTNTLFVQNLDFDTESGDWLLKTTDAVWHTGLQTLVERMLTIPLGDALEKLPLLIDKAYEQGKSGQKTDLEIQSFRFVPQKIAVRPEGIQVLINVESKVGVKVNRL